MKYFMLLFILIAAFKADASYDVSFPTINNKPVVEIIVNDRVCHYEVTWEQFNTLSADELAKKAFDFCRSK